MLKKYKYYILAFIIPIVIIGLILLLNGIFSGEHNLLLSDLYQQYYKLLFEFKNALIGDGNIFYSFSKALGGSMLSTYSYYLLSPFNLLVLFFDNIYHFIILNIIIKLAASSLTMFIYLKYHFKDNVKILSLTFLYTFSLFIISNFFNIIWLDAFLLTPLIMLGIDKLVKEKKVLLYVISLFLMIYSNFYMGFMVCLFSIIYFLYRYFEKGNIKENKGLLIKFIIVSVLTGLSTMFIHYPNILSILTFTREVNIDYPFLNLDFIDFFSNSLMFTQEVDNIINIHSYLLYLGMIMFPLIIMYFVNKKITSKEKILSGCIILILILSIVVSPINFIWYFFSPPNAFNGRFVFMFNLFLIFLAMKSYLHINNIGKKYFYMVGSLILIMIPPFLMGTLSLFSLIVSALFLIAYLVTLYFMRYKNLSILILGLIIIELGVNFYYTFHDYTKETSATESIYIEQEDKGTLFKEIDELANEEFYRSEIYIAGNYNNSYYLNYNGTSSFLSTNNLNSDFYNIYGYGASTFDYDYIPLPVLDSILGIEYLISNYPLYYYDNLYETTYQNTNALSIGYMSKNTEVTTTESSFLNQNELIKSMSGLDLDVYQEVVVNEDGTFSYDKKNQYFFSLEKTNIKENSSYDIYINNEYFKKVGTSSTNNFYLHTYYTDSNNLSFNYYIPEEGEFDIDNPRLFVLNRDNLDQHIKVLKEEQLNTTTFKDGYVKANIVVNETNTLFTSIPYEKGWQVKVNGKSVETKELYDTFLGIELEPGEYEIEFTYQQPGISIGIFISIMSTTILIFYLNKNHKRNQKKVEKKKSVAKM